MLYGSVGIRWINFMWRSIYIFEMVWLILFCGFMDVVFEFLMLLDVIGSCGMFSMGLWRILSFVVGEVERDSASFIVLV